MKKSILWIVNTFSSRTLLSLLVCLLLSPYGLQAQLSYIGERNAAGKAHGRGEMSWRQDTCVIAGRFVDGLPNGDGVLSVLYPNGRRALFRGNIKSTSLSADGKRPLYDFDEGKVIYWSGNGDVYEGQQNKSGYYQGKGELRLRGGTIYQGEFRDDKFMGVGLVRFRDGSIAEGKVDDYDGGEVFGYWSGKFLRVGYLRDNQWTNVKSEWSRTRKDKDLLPRFRTLVEKLGYQSGRKQLKRYVTKEDGSIHNVGDAFVTYAVKTAFRGEVLGAIQLESTPLYVEHCIALVEADGLIMNEMRSSFGDIHGFANGDKTEGRYTCSRTLVYSLDVPYELSKEYREFVEMQREAEASEDLYLILRFVNRYSHFKSDPTTKALDRFISLLGQRDLTKQNEYVRHQVYLKAYEMLQGDKSLSESSSVFKRIGTPELYAKVFANYDPLGHLSKLRPNLNQAKEATKNDKTKSKRK